MSHYFVAYNFDANGKSSSGNLLVSASLGIEYWSDLEDLKNIIKNALKLDGFKDATVVITNWKRLKGLDRPAAEAKP